VTNTDPYGIKTPQPQVIVQQSPSSGGGVGWLIVGLLLGIALLIGYQRFAVPDGGGDREQDKQDQRKDDGKKQEDKKQEDKKPAFKGKTLVFVHERNPQPIEHDLLLRQMDAYTSERGVSYRALDDDMKDEQTVAAVAFAKSKGIDPPFVVLTDLDDKPARAIRWPASVDGLGELFK